jgi:hypothetical protein
LLVICLNGISRNLQNLLHESNASKNGECIFLVLGPILQWMSDCVLKYKRSY